MSNYQFAPSPTLGRSEHPFVTWDSGFTPEEIDRIVELGAARRTSRAVIGGGDVIDEIRMSETSWISNDAECSWIYDRLAYIARQINGKFYGFDLYGFSEDMQFTVYEGEGSHYTWHRDCMPDGQVPRKLSLVVQLSDPSEYEGGDLELFVGTKPAVVDKEKGKIAAFPSYVLHRVTPVTKGIRRTLVVWTTGPAFK